MTNQRDARLYLDDILLALEKIENYTKSMTEGEFIKDEKTIDAVIRNFTVLGEAVKNISSSVRTKYPDIPWRSIAGMRDKLIHEYFGIRYDVVWKTIRTRIPSIKDKIKEILAHLDNNFH